MRDQLTGTSHHIGIAGVSRLDPRDDLAYVPEIYFGSEDTNHISGKLLDGDGEAYVWLGTSDKIDWAEIRLTLQGCLKRRRGPVMHCLVLLLGKVRLKRATWTRSNPSVSIAVSSVIEGDMSRSLSNSNLYFGDSPSTAMSRLLAVALIPRSMPRINCSILKAAPVAISCCKSAM